MFEKEAEEYGEKDLGGKYLSSVVAKDKLHAYKLGQYDGFTAGAEFGYNKANEWHYPSKGEYPDNDNDILCQIDSETFEVGYFNENYNNFFTIDGKEIKVKAWKEIVLPKESE